MATHTITRFPDTDTDFEYASSPIKAEYEPENGEDYPFCVQIKDSTGWNLYLTAEEAEELHTRLGQALLDRAKARQAE